jgi:LmbE family N-acetylglucosaminyl deacetylase
VLLVGAQAPKVWSSAEILHKMKKLNVLGKVLYIAAHPDDENTRLLAYLANERLYRAGYLSLTRGDGGQNLIGDEQGIELGMIRTQELLAARRVDGAEQFFTRAYDFGFSKTSEETLKFWDREKVLGDVVWVIRQFQPDVIIARFPEDSRAGHGHHSASGILAREAYKAAADPNRFPEQMKFGVQAWQAKRLFWNAFNFGPGNNTIESDQLKIDVGLYNALLGKSYGEIAAESRSQHKSQGFGVPSQRGEQFEYFKLLEGLPFAKDIMDEVNVSWAGVKGGAMVQQQLDSVVLEYKVDAPAKSLPRLLALYDAMQALEDGYWKNIKLKELKELIAACAGLYLEASTPQATTVQGDSLRMGFAAIARQPIDARIKQIALVPSAANLPAQQWFLGDTLKWNKNVSLNKMIAIPINQPISQPYWLANGMPETMFDLRDQLLIGDADTKPAYLVNFTINLMGREIVYTRPLQQKMVDPVRGELFQPLAILPRLELKFANDNYVSIGNKPVQVQTMFKRNAKDSSSFAVENKLTSNWQSAERVFMQFGNEKSFAVTPVAKEAVLKEKLSARAELAQLDYHSFRKEIKYDHIPHLSYFSNAQTNLIQVPLQTVGKKIGYIVGAGDKVPAALEQMGYEVVLLNQKDLTKENLAKLDAVVTGVRAYNVHEWLNGAYEVLMNYVRDGGNLIVQYNTSSQIGPVKAKIGPYNFTISRDRVTDEQAVVNFLNPAHPVLNFPNVITAKDFEGWVQERSIYMAQNIDTNYVTPLSMNDAGEKPSNGSLLIGRLGKGHFVYAGLVFFRELPAGVPGAYRLFANLLALGKQPLATNAKNSKKK